MPSMRLAAAIIAAIAVGVAAGSGGAVSAQAAVPRFDHVFLVIDENHPAAGIIGNTAAPEINALAADYGLASRYTGVADPSEPN
jgi:hypothetical protein